MKVLLINPPRSPWNEILAHASKESLPYIHRKLIGPPLGLITVAAALDDDCEVFLLEMKGEYDKNPAAPALPQMVAAAVERYCPNIVGVTTIASEHNAALEILRTVRRVSPSTITIVGGLHATLCPADCGDPAVDGVIPGPGAVGFRDVVRAVGRGTSLREVSGIFLNGATGMIWTGARTPKIEPAGRDFFTPRRDLLEPWKSTYVVGKSPHPATYLFTSQGCEYRCSFCSIWPGFGGEYHQRTVASVIAELKAIDDYPVVRFADANSLGDPRFMDALFDRILDEGIDKFIIMDLRVDAVVANLALIEKMVQGGLKVAICGFESFREGELKGYNKKSSATAIAAAVRILHGNGVMIRGNYVVPPDYEEQDFRALAEYADSYAVAFAGYTILTPMPGTALHSTLKDAIVDTDLDKYNFFNCVLKTKLPLDLFYSRVADLWRIKKGCDVI